VDLSIHKNIEIVDGLLSIPETEYQTYVEQAEMRPTLFDYLFGGFIVAMLATNYSPYNDLLSTIGMVLPLLFVLTLLFTQYHFQREFLAFIVLCSWILLGSLLSRYRIISLPTTVFLIKVQAVMIVVALRCSSFRHMRFYLATIAIGAAFLVLPSLFVSTRYLAFDARLRGGAGDPNALGSLAECSFIAWSCLLFLSRGWLKWIVCPAMAIISLRVVMLSASRGSFVTIVIFAAVGSWYIWRHSRATTRALLPFLIIIAGVVVFISMRQLQIMERLVSLLGAFGIEYRAGSAPISETGVTSREQLIRYAMGIFYDHPILGAGYGTFPVYTGATYTHTTPFDLLYGTGAVGTVLYYFVIFSAWHVLAKAKKLAKDRPEIVQNILIGQMLIIAQLAAGLSLPTQQSKFQATLSGIWLGIAWYMRLWTKEQLGYGLGEQTTAESV